MMPAPDSAREEAGNELEDEADGEQQRGDGGKHGPKGGPRPCAADPRHGLQDAHDAAKCDHDAHSVQDSARTMTLAAVALLVLLPAPALAAGEPGTGLDWFSAAILGVVQGVTEFLPISSDGHLALANAALHLDPKAAGHRFTILVHAGTLLAVMLNYRQDLTRLALAVFDRGAHEHHRLLASMLVASVPLGLVLAPGVESAIVSMESQLTIVGLCLWFTGLLLWLAFRHERLHPPTQPGRLPTPGQALLIGLAQVTAILPGVSRSGTTIAAALLLGIDRATAARFSFLISVIAVGGAVAKETVSVALGEAGPEAVTPGPWIIGFLTSFVVGLAALRGLIAIVARGRVWGFVVYLALIGGAAIALG